MKKFVTYLLVTGLLLCLTACGEEPVNTETHTEAQSSPSETVPSNEKDPKPSFEEVVFVDNDICTFKITAIEEDSIWGYTLKAYLENKTDLELMFSLSNVSVNGFMCDPLWATSVTGGMKANEEINFSSESFKANGIETVTDITFTLSVYDNNDWTAEHLVTETFTIYPLGEEAVESYTRTTVDSETVLFDNENCTMIVTGYDPDTAGATPSTYIWKTKQTKI